MRHNLVLFVALAVTTSARAQRIDRDSLLSEAPGVPRTGTVRVSGVGTGTSNEVGVNGTQGQANIAGSIMWVPIDNLAGDVGMYWQVGANGPSVRLRYQILSQSVTGIDLSTGVRFKTVGFHPDQGEVELLLLAGRRFGNIELVLNGVFGFETGGESGKDAEARAFAGYRFNDDVRAGVDGRIQKAIGEEEAAPLRTGTIVVIAPGRDYDLTVGPAVSWVVARDLGKLFHNLQVQALAGFAQPKRTVTSAAVGIVSASVDFF
jgi:hypothetical protein